jgi:epoxyqueuosine reductase
VSKYHSTLSRREFLKALGIGAAGVGAASLGVAGVPDLARPARDLDELASSTLAVPNRPSYVKEVDKPTVEIDWSVMSRFDYHNVMWAAGLQKALGQTQFDLVNSAQQGNRVLRLKRNVPGYTLKDDAFVNASYGATNSYLPPTTNSTPSDLGVPVYQGTPEENSRMIRSFLRFHGASQVAFMELETDTTEKLIYSYDTGTGAAQGPKITIADVDQPSETKTERILPKKARWVIIYTIRMADELMRRAPTELVVAPTNLRYNLKSIIQGQLQLFLRGLGYMGLGEASTANSLGSKVGMGIMAGLGEHSRAMHVITPEYGLRQGIFIVITDLPLAPGKPVDFGVMRFCRVCKKCSDICPPKALNPDTEPSWNILGDYQQAGIKSWHRVEPRCLSYIKQSGSSQGCILCFAVCPLSKGKNETVYQNLIKRTIATTPRFDRAIRKMDDYLGYGQRNDADTFWDMDLPPFGWD